MRLTWLIVALTIILTACVSKSPAPDYYYYRLNIAAPAKTESKNKVTGRVLVLTPRAPAVYVPRTIAFSEDAEHLTLEYYHYHSWIDPPALLLQQDLARYLQVAGIGTAIITDIESDPPDYRISGEIRHFERIKSPKGWVAAVAMELRVERVGQSTPLLARNYESLVPTKDATMESTIEAFSSATTVVFRDFTADLLQSTRQSSKD